MIIYTSKSEKIELSESPFASGGEGAIYKVESAPIHLQNVCVKIYHSHIVNKQREDRIKYMVANPPSQIRGEGFMLGWPMDYVTDADGKFLGFVMPLGFSDSKELVNLTATTLSKNLGQEWQERYDRSLGKKALLSRLKLICNIAIPVHILHSTGKYVLRDFKPQNVLATADGRITICDMDSIQIAEGGNLLFSGTAATPDYMPPEFYSKGIGKKATDVISESWDTFAMGVVFYQLLFGIHPYVVTPKEEQDDGANSISSNISSGLFPFGVNGDMVKIRPKLHDKFMVLPQELQDLFSRTFDEEEKDRPNAEEWGRFIHKIVTATGIETNKQIADINSNMEINGGMETDISPSVKSSLFSFDNVLFLLSSLFLVCIYSGIISNSSYETGSFSLSGMSIIPAVGFAFLAIFLWMIKDRRKAALLLWTIAAIWLFAYWVYYSIPIIVNDYFIFSTKVHVILIIAALLAVGWFVTSYFKNNRYRGSIVIILATLSLIVYLNPLSLLSMQYIPSLLSVLLIATTIFVVYKSWNKYPIPQILFITTTILASSQIFGEIINIYLYNYAYESYIPFWKIINEGVVCSIIAVLLIIAWTMHHLREQTKEILFFVVVLLCIINVFAGELSFMANMESFAFEYYWETICNYTSTYIFLIIHLCSYLMLNHQTNRL